jgi:hypothetical protein
VPAPDFLAAASISPGERVFKPARTLYFPTTGLLALVRTAPNYPISPCAYFEPALHVLYQGTTLVGPLRESK